MAENSTTCRPAISPRRRHPYLCRGREDGHGVLPRRRQARRCQTPDGAYLVDGKTVTGYRDVAEDYRDKAAGVEIMPWRLQHAGCKLAQMVIDMLGV